MSEKSLREAQAAAVKLHDCPVRWSETDVPEALHDELHQVWVDRLEGVSHLWTMPLGYRYDPLEFLIYHIRDNDDEEFLRESCAAVAPVIDGVRAKYLADTRGLRGLRVATRLEHRKHFPARRLTRAETDAVSLDGVSRFYRGVTPELLTEVLWEALDGRLVRLIGERHLKFFVWCATEVGSSLGSPTSSVCFDIDLSTPMAHAYPFPEAEVPLERRRASSDILQGFVDPR